MIFSRLKEAIAFTFIVNSVSVVDGRCFRDTIEFSETIGMAVEKVGALPTNHTAALSYNMAVADNFDNHLFFIDQLEGIIYTYNDDGSVSKVFDMTENPNQIPAGITIDYDVNGYAPALIQRIHQMAQGENINEVYIVFGSTTLPQGWTAANAKLPPRGAYPGYLCGKGTSLKDMPVFVPDMYRIGTMPDCVSIGAGTETYTVYEVFYKYIYRRGKLINPRPFFVLENQVVNGHSGGGMVTTDGGKVLYGVGDCLPLGSDGLYAPQIDTEHCGKIILIDPKTGNYEVVAKGVRNSQQFRIFKENNQNRELRGLKAKGKRKHGHYGGKCDIDDKSADFEGRDSGGIFRAGGGKEILVFSDIGSTTAQEVNGVPLCEILNRNTIENFGWGRSWIDGKAREGTYYLDPGKVGITRTEPPCDRNAPLGEEGFIQPWIQFGRTATDRFFGISSFVVDSDSFNSLELIWSEFNTGLIMGTESRLARRSEYRWFGPAQSFKIKLYKNGRELKNGCNDLVKEELGEAGYYRGDPRLFHYPDGSAGVFIERTGVFYKLREINIGRSF